MNEWPWRVIVIVLCEEVGCNNCFFVVFAQNTQHILDTGRLRSASMLGYVELLVYDIIQVCF